MRAVNNQSEAVWRDAQKHELDWWTEKRGRLTEPGFLEQKRAATLRIWATIRELLTREPPMVLEIGTGGDGFVNFIPEGYCVGLEPLLPEMKHRGIGIFSPSARFLKGVGERLPFRDRTFDVIFSYNVLDHMANPRRGLDESARVLRPGGILHILVDTYSLGFRLYRRLVRPDPMHPHTFTARQVRRWLSALGFRIVRDVSDRQTAGRRRHRSMRAFCVLEK